MLAEGASYHGCLRQNPPTHPERRERDKMLG
jgi:hypothetical protein